MKKYKVIMLALVTLIVLSIISPANASISHNWLAPFVKNEDDSFYGDYVTGYRAGSTATLVVNVYNQWAADMNVSTVGVKFDWGESYNSTEVSMTNPFPIEPDESHVFTVDFIVPATTIASNLVMHSYEIYVEYVNATTGPKRRVGSDYADGHNFVVFSVTQADAKELKQELGKYDLYAIFFTAKARELVILARGARNQGDKEYQRGDFSEADSYYQAALDNIENAWSNETEAISGFETALKGLIDSGQTVLSMVGWGYTMFGIGFMLMGIGVLVYLIRKSGTPKAS